MRTVLRAFPAACWALLLLACTPLAPDYSVQSYTNATRIKAEALQLVASSSQPYRDHAEAVAALRLDVDTAYEFAAGLPNNAVSAEQWRRMRDPQGGLLFTYLDFWAASPSGVSPALAQEAYAKLAQNFDYIVCLEINKQAASACTPAAGSAS